ncbi:MAG TPA: hypothetical protein VJ508_18325, partial [Saprospiraceae bacterium]|nr:hypothetical protein [Saprospiraceae bacterium]
SIANDGIANPKPGNGINLFGSVGGDYLDYTKIVAPSTWTIGATGQGSGNRTYYVRAKKNATAGSGVGCYTQSLQVTIPDQHISPDMTLTPKFDSFCLATAANGQIGDGTITIAADSDPATAGQQNAAGGFNYVWTTPNAGLASPQNGQSNNFVIPKLGDGTYTVTATNATNKCSVANAVIIDPAPFVITIDNSAVIDQRICNNDGRIKITSVTLKDFTAGAPAPTPDTDTDDPNAATTNNLQALYNFSWYTDPTLTPGNELNGVATTPITSQILSNDSDKDLVTGENGDYTGMIASTYYVTAKRSDNTKIGFGCTSLPYTVVVKDKHVNPVPSLTVLSNTSCLPAGPGEGEITIKVGDATTAPFNGGTYTYTWIAPGPIPPNPPVTNLNPGAGNGDGLGADDTYTELIDNATLGNANPYTVAIANIKTGCVVNASATIIKNATPVF